MTLARPHTQFATAADLLPLLAGVYIILEVCLWGQVIKLEGTVSQGLTKVFQINPETCSKMSWTFLYNDSSHFPAIFGLRVHENWDSLGLNQTWQIS